MKINLENFLKKDVKKSELEKISFEDGLCLMEELVGKVESGKLGLDDSLTAYEKGAHLLKHLRGLLEGAEKKLEILNKK